MKCKRCGSDALIKKDDWYKCANCGALIFDTDIKVNDITSPTKKIEKIESDLRNNTTAKPTAESDVHSNTDKKGKRGEKKEKKPKSKLRETIDFFIPIVIALIISILLKTVIMANAVVPTGSMLNTIHEGDRIIASRLSYVINEPERYDIIIFDFPDDESTRFVKRVIGLPGETVRIEDGKVYVKSDDSEYVMLDDSFVTACIAQGDYGPFVVPQDSYFVMGDNREDSWDSRFWKNKYVHKNKIVGKVKFRYYPSIEKIE